MKLENYKNVIYALGTVISIDKKKIEAWENISKYYLANKKYIKAVICCE